MLRRGFLAGVGVFGLLAALGAGGGSAQSQDVVVFAAASLKGALDEVAGQWSRQSGEALPKISYAASNTLAKQIEQGAPADLFLSADLDWMDYLAGKGLIRAESRIALLGSRIVIIAPKGAATGDVLASGAAMAAALGGGRLATGHVEAVPAGKYGKAALEKLGLWTSVKDRLAQADNARAALLLVSRGEAPLGIVYATDAAVDAGITVVATLPEASHPPIVYPAALTRASTSAAAARFLAFLGEPAASEVFRRHGFAALAPGARTGS